MRETIVLPGSSIEPPKCASSETYYPANSFGFDPVAREHKMLCVWVNKHSDLAQYEVSTLGTNSWRKIDSLPSRLTVALKSTTVVVVSMVLYIGHIGAQLLAARLFAFDVRDEKLIGIVKVPTKSPQHILDPIQLDEERLALASYSFKATVIQKI
ncbi:putative F-box protein At5g15670 [Actinidia eriantha]|uniref:putative F-box protein At5g15670 n=1 Tax=Actinidia eriantha TaxID=165200 RepID=UPI00258999E4|nr:putative F-box protein At5g15670 [Actinidia eriantha]